LEKEMNPEGIKKICSKIAQNEELFYFFDLNAVENRIITFKNTWEEYFSNFKFHYSYKTNALPAITEIIYRQGGGAEIVSGTELSWAIEDGFEGQNIVFDGPVKTELELQQAVTAGVRIQIDSYAEVEHLLKMSTEALSKATFSFRLAVLYKDSEFSRFGFQLEEVESLFKKVKNTPIKFSGLHMHVGSNVNDPNVYLQALNHYKNVIKDFYNSNQLKWLDIGGGYPCHSKKDARPLHSIRDFAKGVYDFFIESDLNPHRIELITEPGRHFVEDFGFLYCQVAALKMRNEKNIAILNTGTNFVRSVQNWLHPISILPRKKSSLGNYLYDIYGCNCFEKDVMKLNFQSTHQLEVGDGVLFGSCGGYDIPSSNPWIRPLPPIYGIYGNEIIELRKTQTNKELRQLFTSPQTLQAGFRSIF
jgi:diaminopimelate decarboxylase